MRDVIGNFGSQTFPIHSYNLDRSLILSFGGFDPLSGNYPISIVGEHREGIGTILLMYLDTSSIDSYITKDIIPWNRRTTLGKTIIQHLFVLSKDNHIIVMGVLRLFSYHISYWFLPKEIKERRSCTSARDKVFEHLVINLPRSHLVKNILASLGFEIGNHIIGNLFIKTYLELFEFSL